MNFETDVKHLLVIGAPEPQGLGYFTLSISQKCEIIDRRQAGGKSCVYPGALTH